jgi:hypothetical protein
LLYQGVVYWSDIIGVVVSLQDSVQNSVAHVERGDVVLAAFDELAQKLEATLLFEVFLEFGADKYQELKDLYGVLSKLEVVDRYQVHNEVKCVKLEELCKQRVRICSAVCLSQGKCLGSRSRFLLRDHNMNKYDSQNVNSNLNGSFQLLCRLALCCRIVLVDDEIKDCLQFIQWVDLLRFLGLYLIA